MTAVLIGIALIAAWCDLRRRVIPNALTLPTLAAGIAFDAWRAGGMPWGAIGAALLAGLPLYLCWLARWVGGGDVKLAAALGAVLADPGAATAMLWAAALAGGVLTLWEWRGWLIPTLYAVALANPHMLRAAWETRPQGTTIPFGVALAAGAVVAGHVHVAFAV